MGIGIPTIGGIPNLVAQAVRQPTDGLIAAAAAAPAAVAVADPVAAAAAVAVVAAVVAAVITGDNAV